MVFCVHLSTRALNSRTDGAGSSNHGCLVSTMPKNLWNDKSRLSYRALKLQGSSRVNVNPQHGIRITNISLDFASVPLSSERTVVTLETGELPEWNGASKDSTVVKTNVIVLGSLMPERVLVTGFIFVLNSWIDTRSSI